MSYKLKERENIWRREKTKRLNGEGLNSHAKTKVRFVDCRPKRRIITDDELDAKAAQWLKETRGN